MDGFIILGNINAITYKEIFHLIKEWKMFTGYNFNKMMLFRISDKYEKYDTIENGVKYGKVPSCAWYTNIHIKKDKPLVLTKSYYNNPELYPKYDNYDAINVDKIKDIPYDYEGVMGVPITFLDKYCPTQFEIIGLMNGAAKDSSIIKGNDGRANFYLNGKPTYARIIVKLK